MQTPGREFPERLFHEEPHQEKHDEEHDEAMGDIVQMMHELRDRRFWGCSLTEIGCVFKTDHGGCPQNPEREEIRSQANHECKPKTRSALSTEGNRAPEPMGNNIHPLLASRMVQSSRR